MVNKMKKTKQDIMDVFNDGPFKDADESIREGYRGYGARYHENVSKILAEKGYELLCKLGEGQTREVYLVEDKLHGSRIIYSSAINPRIDFARKLWGKRVSAFKLPKKELPISSVCTRINRTKKDLEQQEIDILKTLDHPHLAKVYEVFRLGDSRTATIEDFAGCWNLETMKQMAPGFLSPNNIPLILLPVVDAVVYLNHEKGILHRDIKPSNIACGDNGIRLTDFQNAQRISDISEIIMPTRGGTQHTYIDLLNSLVKGIPSKANLRTEVYSLGTTLFYCLNGNDAFKYNIKETKDGQKIDVLKPGKINFDRSKSDSEPLNIRVGLFDGKKRLEEITPEYHEANLCATLNAVPPNYRDLLYRCLTSNPKEAFPNMASLQQNFKEFTKKNCAKTIKQFKKECERLDSYPHKTEGDYFASILQLGQSYYLKN